MKINNFRGDLTDISATKEALVTHLPVIAILVRLEVFSNFKLVNVGRYGDIELHVRQVRHDNARGLPCRHFAVGVVYATINGINL